MQDVSSADVMEAHFFEWINVTASSDSSSTAHCVACPGLFPGVAALQASPADGYQVAHPVEQPQCKKLALREANKTVSINIFTSCSFSTRVRKTSFPTTLPADAATLPSIILT